VIKLILGIGEPLIGKLLLYDALDMSFQTVQLRKNPKCKVCGTDPQIKHLIDYEAFCGVPTRGTHVPEGIPEITPLELAQSLQGGQAPLLLDVREEVESQVSCLPGAVIIPLGQLPTRLEELDHEDEVVVYCRTGVRSARAADILMRAGFQKVKNLRGGINAWARDVDPKMMTY
jgi:sulfur-carrier protein adenylyltransferase/sulfurtransferase